MSTGKTKRQVIPLKESFFNDGPWYVLSSTSLGGSKLSPEGIAGHLQSEDADTINRLLKDGICLPLFFPGDCALDEGIVVIGDLTEQEDIQWIGRLQSKLEIPCGEFMVMGGGMEEDFDVALNHFEAPDPHFRFFQKFKLEPGTYLVEVYAFISSMTVNFAWEELPEDEESIENWWKRTRPGQTYPKWLNSYLEEDYVDSDEHDLVQYIIRLTPAVEDIPLPTLDDEYNWCADFEIRRPEPCPEGISRRAVGS